MRKKLRQKTILIEGIRYYADKPFDCRLCFFWKNRKVGCILEETNCYYLAEVIKTEQEHRCENCCYARGEPCVSAVCYKQLERMLQANREKKRKKGGRGLA